MQLNVGTDFSGIGSVEQALDLLGIDHKTAFACDWDKFARKAYSANYGKPKHFPKDVHDRVIPEEPLDFYVTSPPCQPFSKAGKRQGEDDKRGILFYNSHYFIQENKPRRFIFENVRGLLSHDRDKNDKNAVYGRTFNKWVQYLGGKSINGNSILFPIDEAVPYHIYFKVLKATDYGIPQARERVFIVGIRDDEDNQFSWPKPVPLKTKLIDLLEPEVEEKYFLSKKMLSYLIKNADDQKAKGNGFKFTPLHKEDVARTIRTKEGQRMDDNFILINSATASGYEIATPQDSINYSVLSSQTRRGRVGKGVAQTLDTACNQAVLVSKEVRTQESKDSRKETGTHPFRGKTVEFRPSEVMNSIKTSLGHDNFIVDGYRVRRLTPRECLRLMGFPDTFKIACSDVQTYKQAGNSIVVHVMAALINNLLKQ
jgi:DNA (cytosine-5)-methyltransferase 1